MSSIKPSIQVFPSKSRSLAPGKIDNSPSIVLPSFKYKYTQSENSRSPLSEQRGFIREMSSVAVIVCSLSPFRCRQVVRPSVHVVSSNAVCCHCRVVKFVYPVVRSVCVVHKLCPQVKVMIVKSNMGRVIAENVCSPG